MPSVYLELLRGAHLGAAVVIREVGLDPARIPQTLALVNQLRIPFQRYKYLPVYF